MKVLYVDLERCIYCRACEVACEREHDGISRITVTLVDASRPAPLSCRHCEIHPCLDACPADAIELTEQGAVIIHSSKCVSCGLCVLACPFGIIELDGAAKVAEKCDLCVHRRNRGLQPACVLTCPARCIQYDELEAIIQRARARPGFTLVSAVGDAGTVITLPEPRVIDSARSNADDQAVQK